MTWKGFCSTDGENVKFILSFGFKNIKARCRILGLVAGRTTLQIIFWQIGLGCELNPRGSGSYSTLFLNMVMNLPVT